MDSLLLGDEYLKANSLISDNVQFEELRPLIYAIQDLQLTEIVGTKLLEALIIQTNTEPDTLTADNKILLDKYLLPYMNWTLCGERCRIANTKLYPAGTMVNRTDNSDPVDNSINESKFFFNKAAGYQRKAINFLAANATLYPLLEQNIETDEVKPVKSADNASGLYLSDNFSTPRY